MDYLVQREGKDFATFHVGPASANALVESAGGKMLYLTKQELVQATADTIERWHPVPHVWHPDFIALLRSVTFVDEWSAADQLNANIPINLCEYTKGHPLRDGCELRYSNAEVTVTIPLLLFWSAAEDHLKSDPRLPTRNLHPGMARLLKQRWASMIERLAQTEARKQA